MNNPLSLTVNISATKAMEKWLDCKLERMPSPDGKRIGTQPLLTNAGTISWQCHVIENRYGSGPYTVIAVEAHSRYTLLLPFEQSVSLEEFWERLAQAWATNLTQQMLEYGFISEEQEALIYQHFFEHALDLRFYRNTDLSVNGHVTDAEQWVTQTLADANLDRLDAEHAYGLGMHINQMFKRAKNAHGEQERFYPISRFLPDGLYRFASGLAKETFIGVPEGDYPDPYTFFEKAETQTVTQKLEPGPRQGSGNLNVSDPDFLIHALQRYGNPKSIANVSELDGFLTAIVSGPAPVLPSVWLPLLWGGPGLDPAWESQEEAQRFIELVIGHMNTIADVLIERPEDFQPLFLPEQDSGRYRFGVEPWCAGYVRAISASATAWDRMPDDQMEQLGAITTFGTEEQFKKISHLSPDSLPDLAARVPEAARALHAYNLYQRGGEAPPFNQLPARNEAKVGRNEPCPCGSGRKYKKCCLH